MNNLSTRIKNALETSIVQEIRKPSDTLYPSSASIEVVDKHGNKKVIGACLRQQYYRAISEPISNKIQTDHKISGMLGDKITEFVKEFLDNNGYSCKLQRVAEEHSFYIPEINLSGRCDFLAYDYENDELIGLEIKSVGEYKASKCIQRPSDEHILQSIIYLDWYSKRIPLNKWYIVYISRTENYAIKAKKHGSPLAMIWDYYIKLGENGTILYSANGREILTDYTVSNIYDRYRQLNIHLETRTIPDRDYHLQYSDSKILELYKNKELTRKADIEKVEKWIKKGCQEGKLKIEMGDMECQYCPYKSSCWPEEAVEISTDALFPNTENKNNNEEQTWI